MVSCAALFSAHRAQYKRRGSTARTPRQEIDACVPYISDDTASTRLIATMNRFPYLVAALEGALPVLLAVVIVVKFVRWLRSRRNGSGPRS
jgi:hypothetical protein